MFRKLFGPKTAESELQDLRARHATLAAEAEAAAQAHEAASAALQDFYLNGDLTDAPARGRLERTAADAATRAGPLAKSVADLASQIAAAEQRQAEADAEAERVAAYEVASAELTALERDLPARYNTAAREIVELIGRMANTAASVRRANSDLPAGRHALALPGVATRGHRGLEERVVSERFVDGWARKDSGAFVEGTVFQDAHDWQKGRTPTGAEVVRARFREQTVLPYCAPSWAEPLWKILRLPSLVEGDAEHWEAPQFEDEIQHRVTTSLSADRSNEPQQPKREPRVRYEKVAEAPEPPPQPEPPSEEEELERIARLADRRAPYPGAFLGGRL